MYIKRSIKIFGLFSVLLYMINILYFWIESSHKGLPYFSVGEPILWIKYSEWIFGFIGIIVILDLLIENIKKDTKEINKKYLKMSGG